jgi:hypothetical protein
MNPTLINLMTESIMELSDKIDVLYNWVRISFAINVILLCSIFINTLKGKDNE